MKPQLSPRSKVSEERELITHVPIVMNISAPVDVRLEHFVRGDLTAFESLFRDYQSEVYGWIMRIVRDPSTAEELTVETFWRVWKARSRFDPRRSFGAWLRRIACNMAVTHLKHRARADTPLLVEPEAAEAADPVVSRETAENIVRAFRELPAKLQVAATLALLEEQAYADIAAALGISVGGVKSRVFRAVRILRRKLERMGITP